VDLCPAGELDAYSFAQCREVFAELGSEPRLVVNLSGVQFMDSGGLGARPAASAKCETNEGRITVCTSACSR